MSLNENVAERESRKADVVNVNLESPETEIPQKSINHKLSALLL